jgi:hypothetical protein
MLCIATLSIFLNGSYAQTVENVLNDLDAFAHQLQLLPFACFEALPHVSYAAAAPQGGHGM